MDQTTIPPENPSQFKLENMTRQQLKRIQKSMKQPQFMGLLNQYMVQISDPKNKQQYDEYLKQMQRQGQLPKHMKLCQLTPHFCIKTNIVSQKNKKHNMKFFINYCSTQYIQQPICQPSLNEQGKSAFGWRVPNSMGKIRYDQDKHGNPCQVADVAFNNKCFDIIEAQNNLPFRKNQFKSMLISIGLQCAEKQLGQRKQTLSKDYDILKNIKCKGGKPALLPLRYIKGKAYNKGEGPNQNQIERNREGAQTKLQKQINQQKQKAQLQKAKQQSEKKDDQIEEQLQQQNKLVQDLEEGIQRPKYSSIYTYPVDYSQFLQDPSYNKASKTPSHFTVEFKLPRVEGMQQIGGDSLNINQNRIVLKIGQKYFIDLPFDVFKTKYKLITDKIKAKFDKKKKILKITFAIDQSIKYHNEQQKPKIQMLKQQNQAKQQVQQSQVVQNQTWKNKVLQVAESNVNLKIIQNKQNAENQTVQQPKNKLIEEIDEDDYPEQNKVDEQKQSKQASNFQQALQNQKNHAFSLRNYYRKYQPNTKAQQKAQINREQQQKEQQKIQTPSILSHVFQQTSDKIVLVVKMQNYKKQQVKIVYDQQKSNNFFIEWNKNQSSLENQAISNIHISNLKIDQKFQSEIKNVEIVFRLNFVAIFINKNTAKKFWQKESIIQILNQKQKSILNTFIIQRNRIQAANQEARKQLQSQKLKNKKNQGQEIQEKNDLENIQKQKNQVNNQKNSNIRNQVKDNQYPNSAIKNNIESIEDPQNTENNNRNQNNSKLKGQYFSFNSLPPQFLQFDIKFIQTLD